MPLDPFKFQQTGYQNTKPPAQVNQFKPIGTAANNALGAFGSALIGGAADLKTLLKPNFGPVYGQSGTQTSTPTGVGNFNLAQPPVTPKPTVMPPAQPVAGPTITRTTKTVETAPNESYAVGGWDQPGLQSGQTAPASTLPTPSEFGRSPLNESGEVPSTAMGSNLMYSDIIKKRNDYENKYREALLEANRITAEGNVAATDALYKGDSVEYAQGQSERIGRIATLNSMAATGRAEAYGKLLGINQQDITNSLNTAPTNIGSNVNPATGDVYITRKNPVTGSVETVKAGNVGAQKQYTSTSVNTDPMTGQLIFTGVRQDGTIENQVLSGGGQGSTSTDPWTSAAVPASIQSAMGQTGSRQYIDTGSLSAAQLPMAQAYSAQSGIPLLRAEDAAKVKEADSTFSSANTLLSTIETLYKDVITAQSPSGIPAQFLKRKLGSMFKSDANAAVYESTVKSFTSLLTRAAGEKGTLSDSDKEALINAIPKFSDTVEIADGKMKTLKDLFQSTRDGVINSYLGSKAISQGGSTGQVVQTKVGAINTDW